MTTKNVCSQKSSVFCDICVRLFVVIISIACTIKKLGVSACIASVWWDTCICAHFISFVLFFYFCCCCDGGGGDGCFSFISWMRLLNFCINVLVLALVVIVFAERELATVFIAIDGIHKHIGVGRWNTAWSQHLQLASILFHDTQTHTHTSIVIMKSQIRNLVFNAFHTLAMLWLLLLSSSLSPLPLNS